MTMLTLLYHNNLQAPAALERRHARVALCQQTVEQPDKDIVSYAKPSRLSYPLLETVARMCVRERSIRTSSPDSERLHQDQAEPRWAVALRLQLRPDHGRSIQHSEHKACSLLGIWVRQLQH